MTVARIRAERDLRLRLRELVEEPSATFVSALDRLNVVRAQLRNDPRFKWALQAEDAEALHGDHTILQALRRILPTVARMYLWPLAIPPIIVFVVGAAVDFRLGGLGNAVQAAFNVALGTVIVAAIVALLAYLVFRRRENRELPEDLPPDPAAVERIVARENYAAQNHLAAVSVMKSGVLRGLAVRFVFAAIAQLATHLYRPGWLGTLGTIHFARWVTVPGTRDLLFLSNYGGSWESYLEDFITKAHNGLTGVWSNTLGFPRTSNLIQFGARDGDRFKRWARRQMVPTGCW